MKKQIIIYALSVLVVLLVVVLLTSRRDELLSLDAVRTASDVENPSRLDEATNAVESSGRTEPTAPSVGLVSVRRVGLADLPAGKLRTALIQMPEALRDQVLMKITALEIPENDYASLRVHPNGALYYVCDFGGAMPLANREKARSEAIAEKGEVGAAMAFTTAVPIASPPVFHSRPGATKVLFLDFNGAVVTNTSWNSDPDFAEPFWDCRPYSLDGNDATFSVAEQQAIQTIWERVAEDYAPFDVDVTTEQPPVWNRHVGHVLITPEIDKNGVHCPHYNAGGIAFVDVFGIAQYSYDYAGECYSPAWVLNYEANGYAEFEAEAASHEMGHNLALSHDGTKSTSYYGGHANGSISWGPIMGTGYDRNVSQWSKGDYSSANNTEDDLALIAVRLAYRPDDAGNDFVSPPPLSLGFTGTVEQTGVIETTTDEDVFSFTASAGPIDIVVSPYRDSSSTTWGGNLDIVLELYDGTGALMATNNPVLETTAGLSTVVSNGTYYLKIRSTGVGNPLAKPSPTGYVRYGSIGQYFITGNIVINNDWDGDGLPNEWEMVFFGDPTNAVAGLDSDNDGADNLSEFIAGFDPTNAASVFMISGHPIPPSNSSFYVITWSPVEGRQYDVGWVDDLQNTSYSNLVEDVAPPQSSYTDSVDRAGFTSFYRVDVRLSE